MPLFARTLLVAVACAVRRRRPLSGWSSSPPTTTLTSGVGAGKRLLPQHKPRGAGDADVMGFADSRVVRCSAGRGGDGLIAFTRLYCNPMAGPGGGDGGHGGHVVLSCDESVRDLSSIPPEVRAEGGRRGGSANCHGRRGEHATLLVPPGTQVLNEDGKVLHELEAHGQVYVAARGGAGGKGNAFFLSNENRAPQLAEYGAEGESRFLDLRLRVLADAGLVGFPNAGKSSLLRALSRARPRVSPYPFTTLQPHIGVLKFADLDVTVADIPGLIDGAHENRGLGHDFLRHVARCPCLLCVVDLGGEDPVGQFETLLSELDHFSPNMSASVRLLVANKIDLSYAAGNMELLAEAAGTIPIVGVSAKTGQNVDQLAAFLHAFFRFRAHA